MGTTFVATADVETFTNGSHSILINARQGVQESRASFSNEVIAPHDVSDPNEPYNGFIEGFQTADLSGPPSDPNHTPDLTDALASFINADGDKNAQYYFEIFDRNLVDYSASPSAVLIDLERSEQRGGFAEGDVLVDMGDVFGSRFNDVIRGSNVTDYPPDRVIARNGTTPERDFFTLANPGQNTLFGGDGDDVLEGRGGGDSLRGGSGFDFASYESSPARVIVQLGEGTQAAIAAEADAEGDTFSSIEGLIGSRFDDRLAGNSSNNVFTGGLGSDFIDGLGGIDTADYSRNHLFDPNDSPFRVVVQLGSGDNAGTAAEFTIRLADLTVVLTSTDTLFHIENVIGTAGSDQITGNDQSNTLDGRDGNDTLDGGLGNDILMGGDGIDTASFASHNGLSNEIGNIALGLAGANGTARYSVVTQFGPIVVETDALRGIENITGSSLVETITGNELSNVIDGGLGNDTLNGGDGVDTVSFASHDGLTGQVGIISLGLDGADGSAQYGIPITVLGQPTLLVRESDVLRSVENVTGSNLNETINGNELNNVLDGRGGIDTINAGAGNDTLIGGVGNDILNGGADNDTYDFRGSGLGNDHFFDTSGSDRVLINSLSDILSSQRVGDDLVVNLTTGSFTVVDHFDGHAIESLVTADGKTVTLATGLVGGNANGIISGGKGDETLDGKGGDDLLYGGRGRDTLLGGDGDDLLAGQQGNDWLTGGAGADTFVFEKGDGHDTVTDFQVGVDHLKFDDCVEFKFLSERDVDHDGTVDTVVHFDGGSVTLLGTGAIHDWHLLL
jgi:Ca2+-binding RTX toxin-like protein